MLRISLYSVRIQENTDQKNSDTFDAVSIIESFFAKIVKRLGSAYVFIKFPNTPLKKKNYFDIKSQNLL